MDKRKNNGGHSTKAKGIDKRKNDYRRAIEESMTTDDIALILRKCKDIALSDDKDRITAIKILLEYTLGKPHQTISEEIEHKFPIIDMNEWI